MSEFVVDASVAVKWFIPETHSETAAILLDDAHELHGPDLLFPEFGNILWKKVNRDELTLDDALTALQGLQAAGLELHATDPLLEPALRLGSETGRTVYDYMYVALAIGLDLRLVTADERLYNALQSTPHASHLMRIQDLPAT